MVSLVNKYKFECRVKSVLNKNNRSYGKNYMFDDCPDTCWNSDAGTPQWVVINFEEEHELTHFKVQFQGGFAGKDCHLEIGDKETIFHETFYPEDKNTIQMFRLNKPAKAKIFKFVFNESTDLFGRIIIYQLYLYS